MADPNLGQTVTHAWEAIVKSQPEDNIFEDYWLFSQLKSGSGFKTIDGGRQIQQPIEYATNTTVAEHERDGDDLHHSRGPVRHGDLRVEDLRRYRRAV